MYSVNPQEIREAKPRFACVACQTQFWLAFPECLQHPEIIGFPINWLKPQLDFAESKNEEQRKDCPKCHAKVVVSAKECTSCGLVFEKYKAKLDLSGPEVSPRLKKAWENILEEFDREDLHQTFLRACQDEGHLSYALHRYTAFLEAQPTDRLARRMRESAKALLEMKVEIPMAKVRNPQKRFRPLTLAMILLSVALLTWGFSMPEFRNMIGFGAAMLFLSLALRFYGPNT